MSPAASSFEVHVPDPAKRRLAIFIVLACTLLVAMAQYLIKLGANHLSHAGLVATASNDKQGSGSVTVVVSAAPAAVAVAAPAVSAGLSQTILLPNTTATVAASAAGANGAKITKAVWQQGPQAWPDLPSRFAPPPRSSL